MIMEEKDILSKLTEKNTITINSFVKQLNMIHTGNINASIFYNLKIKNYNSVSLLNNIANLSIASGTQLIIKPYDRSSECMINIQKAISEFDKDLTVKNEGEILRVNFPIQSLELRQKNIKKINTCLEQFKVHLRQNRHSILKTINNAEMSKNQIYTLNEKIQKILNDDIHKVEELSNTKKEQIKL